MTTCNWEKEHLAVWITTVDILLWSYQNSQASTLLKVDHYEICEFLVPCPIEILSHSTLSIYSQTFHYIYFGYLQTIGFTELSQILKKFTIRHRKFYLFILPIKEVLKYYEATKINMAEQSFPTFWFLLDRSNFITGKKEHYYQLFSLRWWRGKCTLFNFEEICTKSEDWITTAF